MKNKVIVMVMMCALLVSMMTSGTVAYADVSSYYYDEEKYAVGHVGNTATQSLDETTIARIKAGYGLTIFAVDEGNSSYYEPYNITVLTYPKGYHVMYYDDCYFIVSDSLEFVSAETGDLLFSQASVNDYGTMARIDGFRVHSYADSDYTEYCHYGYSYDTYSIPASGVMYSDGNIYYRSGSTYTLTYQGTAKDVDTNYTLEEWMADAKMKCAASSNESASVIPFWYDDAYEYIVRKGSDGNYYLTMIQNSVDLIQLYYVPSTVDSSVGNIGLKTGSETEFAMTVRDFVYDTDGWKLVEKNDISMVSGTTYTCANCTLDSTKKLLYHSADIEISESSAVIMYSKTSVYDDTYIGAYPEEDEEDDGTSGGGTGGGSRGESYAITVDVITVYEDSWNTSDELGKLYKNDVVEVLEVYESTMNVNPWYRVLCEIDGAEIEGWINGGIAYDASEDENDTGNSGGSSGGSNYFDTTVEWNDIDLKDSVTGLVEMVGAVPTIIAGIFSFLPSWCLAVVGVAFSMVLVLFVVKVIRG